MPHMSRYIAAIALAAALWAAPGESSDPVLGGHELPPEIRNDCGAAPMAAGTGAVCTGEDYTTRWISRSATGGELFMVLRTPCDASGCRAWLVQRSEQTTRTLLAITGKFRLQRTADPYPAVQERTALSHDYVRYSRFVWDGSGYARTGTRLVHTVDGFECGTRDECFAAAGAALDANQTDRAVRIWQHVHGVAWI